MRRREDGRYEVALALGAIEPPVGVREVVAGRVDQLGEPSARALAVAAVIGREFPLGLLAAVSEQDEDELVDRSTRRLRAVSSSRFPAPPTAIASPTRSSCRR